MQGFVDFDRIHESWRPFFRDDIIEKLHDIEAKAGDNYTPEPQRVLRFASTDLHKVKAVILGQDPYPQRGVSTGRAFEVCGLNSWLEKFKQSSLRNILRNLYKSRTGKIKTINEIRGEIADGSFKILPPCAIFEHWENQGVLLLNTFLTCEVGKSGSHKALWTPVTDELIRYIAENNPRACWFLWGNQAGAYAEIIGDRKLYMSNHPMMADPKNPADFLNNPCFFETAETLGIDWGFCEPAVGFSPLRD